MTNWQLLRLMFTNWGFWLIVAIMAVWGWFQVWLWS